MVEAGSATSRRYAQRGSASGIGAPCEAFGRSEPTKEEAPPPHPGMGMTPLFSSPQKRVRLRSRRVSESPGRAGGIPRERASGNDFLGFTRSGFGMPSGTRAIAYSGRALPRMHNNKVAGYGRLRRPSSQPAMVQKGLGNSISVGSVAEPGN